MRVMEVREPGAPFVPAEREIPEPGPGQVRIKVAACGICHSDAFIKSGGFPGLQLPRVPGHEVSGTIDAVGDGVSLWKVGDRVGVGWHGGHCFQCESCRRGHFINCVNGKITGVSHDGGYGEYMLSPWEAVARMPDDLDFVDAGPLLCAGITTYNALRNSGARAGDTVAIQGIGGLGHLAVQYARQMGFRTVALSRGADKEALAKELGAHIYIDTKTQDAAAALQALGGADVILCTAPNTQAIESVLGGLARRGKLMLVAAPQGAIQVHPLAMLSGKMIHGWPSGSPIDSEDTMDFSVLTGVRPHVEVFPLEQANEAFQVMMENRARFRVVLTPGG
ncbi:MAG: alcohol dehydrogenase catalytic domain-containing protein [Myxococcales bacterium]|nr:alcohol dehydrogenase catalytic domain-containing protein [Myxococcales bacterium]